MIEYICRYDKILIQIKEYYRKYQNQFFIHFYSLSSSFNNINFDIDTLSETPHLLLPADISISSDNDLLLKLPKSEVNI